MNKFKWNLCNEIFGTHLLYVLFLVPEWDEMECFLDKQCRLYCIFDDILNQVFLTVENSPKTWKPW